LTESDISTKKGFAVVRIDIPICLTGPLEPPDPLELPVPLGLPGDLVPPEHPTNTLDKQTMLRRIPRQHFDMAGVLRLLIEPMRFLRLGYLVFFLPWGFRLGLARSGRAEEELPGLLCDSLDSLGCLVLLKNGSNSSANVSGGLVFLSLGLSAFGALGNEGR
jgi:hypothetical protein